MYSARGLLNAGILLSLGPNVYLEDYMSVAVLSNIVSLFAADVSLLSASK